MPNNSKQTEKSTAREHTSIVPCPTCNTSVAWLESSKFRPFCSERCRLIDLGEWASESYRIADLKGTPPNTLE